MNTLSTHISTIRKWALAIVFWSTGFRPAETAYATPQYHAEIPGIANVTDSNPVFLSNRTETVDYWAGNVAGQATHQEIAAASFGQLRGSLNADYLNVSPVLPINGGTGSRGATSSFNLDDLVITGPPGNIEVSFNYSISGSIGGLTVTTGDPAFYGWHALVDVGGGLQSSFSGFGFNLGGMFVRHNGEVQRHGIFNTSTFPVNSSGTSTGTTPLISTFAGDPNLRFSLSLSTGASAGAGSGAEPGKAYAYASFANTFGFPASGTVANLPEGYTLNSLSGHIVNNQFVMPSPTGDFDGNLLFNCADVDALVGEVVTGNHTQAFDLTVDGLVNDDDLSVWLMFAGANNLASRGPYRPGDANLDGVVDGSDFGIWNSNKFTSVAAWCGGDFNADGVVDGSDFGTWNDNKFTSSDSLGVVPEPTSSTWCTFLAAGLLFRGRAASRTANGRL